MQEKGSGLNGTNLKHNPFSQYDFAGRVTQVDNTGGVVPEVTLTMAYDFEGNRVWLSDSQGGSVWYAWNNQRLQSMAMTTEAGKYAGVGFTYNQVGRLNSISRMVNGDPSTTINTSYTLDLLDRVTGITHSKVSGEESVSLSQFSYTYDANGRVIGSTGPEGSLSFALDANGQLLSVTGSRSEAYTFNANGNRSTNTISAGNLLVSDGQFSYTYDFEGNRKTRTRLSDGQVTEYFWDHRNQLTKALIKDANGVLLKELRFTYDVEGRRVGVWVDADGTGPGSACGSGGSGKIPSNRLTNQRYGSATSQLPKHQVPNIPGSPATSLGPGWTWRGKPGEPIGGDKGAWFNPKTGETLHPDLGHGVSVGPHWDWRDPDGNFWRLFPDGRIKPRG